MDPTCPQRALQENDERFRQLQRRLSTEPGDEEALESAMLLQKREREHSTDSIEAGKPISASSQKLRDQGYRGANMGPEFYLIRLTASEWALFPFTEDIWMHLQDMHPVFLEVGNTGIYNSVEETLEAIHLRYISIVMDPDEWAVMWSRASEVVPEETLLAMETYY